MLIVRGESRLPAEELLRRAKGKRVVLLDAGKVSSLEELELAHALAKKSLADGTAVSKNLEIEFVLWLAGKKDIRRAFGEIGWNGRHGKEFIAVSFGRGRKELVGELEMKEKKPGAGNRVQGAGCWMRAAGWEAVERISLGRIS